MKEQKDGKRALTKRHNDHVIAHRRRILLLSLLLCVSLLVALSLVALANQSRSPAPPQPSIAPLLETTPSPSPTPVPTPTPTPEPTFDFSLPAPESTEVDDGWFSDAVFLGDSRSDGLRLYSGIRGADFLAYKSLMVFQANGTDGIEAKAIPMNGTGDKKTVLEWLEERQYGKVYIMFGINELGYGNNDAFAASFETLVDEVRTRQPSAVLYIQSLVPVEPEAAQKTNPATWLNNENVAEYNAILRQVCTDKNVVYVDVQSAMVGEDGALPKEGTTDGIHFTRTWYQKWYAYLKTHTVDPAEYAGGQVGDL